jgi:P-type Ca2+ transporter type 2C
MRRQLPADRFNAITNHLTGLDPSQVAERQARFGPNVIVAAPSSGWRDLVRDTLRDPMLWFLAGTSLLFLVIGDVTEAIILAVALVPILGMDAFLHRRTQASTQALSGGLASFAWVIRDSGRRQIAAIDLVPGDLAFITESQPIPADGVIVSSENLQLDESALTGEAMPVRKTALRLAPEAINGIVAQDANWVFAGTRSLTGQAVMQVVFTGADTYYGEIAQSAQAGRRDRTPLQRQITSLTQWLVVIALVFCVALALTRLLQGHGLVDAIISATTLAVAALPEEFPVVFSFFLGVGVYRLAREKALVRRAVVVENIGRISCICSDKTGTLTEGQLRLSQAEPASGFDRDEILQAAATASRRASGDPLDTALLDASPPMPGVMLANFPFTEDRRREACVIQTVPSGIVCFAKGAPETIFQQCGFNEHEHLAWREKTRSLASSGRKVIACCRLDLAPHDWKGEEPQAHYKFLGLLAFEDPVRVGVPLAVAEAQHAGIRLIMVTGDHPDTARAIAQAIGLGPPQEIQVIEGETLAQLLATEGINGIRNVSVIARARPSQKLALVRALQASGEIVAVTGDGVNDVPALQCADIGIAMGERGTRAAREAASIVLIALGLSSAGKRRPLGASSRRRKIGVF